MTRRKGRLFQIQSTAILLAASAVGAAVKAGPALPVPCAPGACGAKGASQFVTSGTATAVATQNALTITQSGNSAILNWSSFNIGANGSVTFKQPSASAIALNRIFQGSPSQIFGNLTANGQVYLINLNGFLFGPTSTINVGSLIASSLPLTLSDANFNKGILSPFASNEAPTFDATCTGCDPLAPGGRTSVLDTNGNRVLGADGKPLTVQVVVQPGAQITAADQGRVLLAGQSVSNAGTISAPDGQIVLAAGTKVYLQASADPGLRGLIVEVDGNGTAANQLSGLLTAPRGNITMVGLAVNQDGRISATTSVSANGSIRLEAANLGGIAPSGTVLASSQGGVLTVGPQSEMQILPELASSATEVPAQTQLPSSIALLGEQVLVQGGSIAAPNGNLTAIAAANPSPVAAGPTGGVPGTLDPNARLHIDAGTSIDLSGSTATLPVSANLVSGQLRSTELADDPTQRTGALHGLTVYVDARDLPSNSFANLSGEVAAVPQSVAQRTETGGNAIFQSQGDVVFASGASLNVSGGSTTYTGGVLQTTYLVGANGQLYPIATANPLVNYVGVVNPTFTETYNTWGIQTVKPTPGLSYYSPGYVEGAAAGSVQFVAPSMVLQGTLQGSAVNGLYQRTPTTSVSGGHLIIGLPGGAGDSTATAIDYIAPAVQLSNSPTPVVVGDDATLPTGLTLQLPVSYLTSNGFTSTQIYSNFGVTLPANTPLVLPAGSTFAVDAARVDVLSNVLDPAGALSFQNVATYGFVSQALQTEGNEGPGYLGSTRAGVFVGDGVTLDTRGLWTNDVPAAQAGGSNLAQTWQNGGSINLGVAAPGALLSLGDNVALRVSGGGWLNAQAKLTAGTGGSITLNENAVLGGLDVGNNVAIDGFGLNGAAGGSFNLSAPRVEIVAGNGSWATGQQVDDTLALGNVFALGAGLFSNDGFQNISITASGLVAPSAATSTLLSIDPGVALAATVSSLVLEPGSLQRPSAASVAGLAVVSLLPEYLRPAATLSFDALPPTTALNLSGGGTVAGDIAMGAGASITTDAGGVINMTSLGSILIDGVLSAPAGDISLHIVSPAAISPTTLAELYPTFDVGFLSSQRIDLGNRAVLDASGTLVSQPSSFGLSLGTAYSGGTVNVLADRGAVVTEAGSLISVAGTAAALDVMQASGAYAHEIETTAGGSIVVHSGEAISLLGAIEAAAGTGGTSGPAAGGSLDLALTRLESWWSTSANSTFNPVPLSVILEPSVPASFPSAANSNQAFLGAAQLAQSGLDALRIEAGGALQVSGNVELALARQLVIDAPVVSGYSGAQANLSAAYVELGFEPPSGISLSVPAPTGGSAAINWSGNEIDLVGNTVFQGASTVRFDSAGDLVLRGQPLGTGLDTLTGSIAVAGNLTLNAARIYPVTATSFSIDAADAPGMPGTVTIGQTGANPGTPYSAGGALSITADSIVSTGTLYAPFGTIALDGRTSVTLGDGSLTSVSGGGLTIPYGVTQYGGDEWGYEPNGATSFQSVSGVPARTVSLTAPSISVTKQATVDLSGGGDLSAYEWVPGTGGTQDALGAGVTPGLYAILPSTRGEAAPQDPQYSSASNILAGETVDWSGGGGLAAGIYPLLSARYALVPGAYLIQVEPQYQSVSGGSLGSLANGTPVVAGFLSYGDTGLHLTPGYTGFAIYPGSYGSQLADYTRSVASTFFAAVATAAGDPAPTLPADAGTLQVAVSSATSNLLDLNGVVRTAAAPGGVAASIDLTANDLVVGTATGNVPADAVTVAGSVLAGWQPGSLLLGGIASADGSAITVGANTVTVGAGTTLTANQIAIVANQAIDVQSGATLQTTSAAAGGTATAPLAQSVLLTGTAGSTPALLAVSDLNWLIPTRTAAASVSGTPLPAATVAIDVGGTIASRGSLTVDGQGGVSLNGTTTGAGAEWSLGSSSIAFVPAGGSGDALAINPGLVSQLDAAAAVRLASTGAIDVMTPVTLGVSAAGAPTLQALTLSAASLNDVAGGASASPNAAQFGAQTLTLQGAGSSSATPVAGPAGASLTFAANVLDLGPGFLAVNGFATTHAGVTGAVIGEGSGGLSVGGDLSLTTAGITAAGGSQTLISSTGTLSLASAAGTTVAIPTLLGGSLSLSGATVDLASRVVAPSGRISITATDELDVAGGSLISTAGTVVSVQNQSVGTPGGTLSLTAGGNLNLGAGSILDVSGAGSAAGGAISLGAGGAAALGATLRGSGGSGAAGGSFSLDVGSLAPVGGAANALDALAASLTTGGFDTAIDVRARTGNLVLDGGSALTANTVSLTADTGQVIVGGSITADSGALRGMLSLFGGTGVELTAGGALHADGIGAGGLGGAIEIGAGELVMDSSGTLDAYNGATINLDAGSSISTAGSGGNGYLLLRAPAIKDPATPNAVIGLGSLASTLTGVNQVVIEPVLPFNTANTAVFSPGDATAPTAGDFATVQQNVANYMATAAPLIAAQYTPSGGTPLVIEPGVEIIATSGALTIASSDGVSPALDLSTWRYNGAPVDFTVRATGDITVANSITDGFIDAQVGHGTQSVLLPGASSSIRLIAGADLASANPLQTVTGGSGDLTIGLVGSSTSALVRTGTGDVDLVAAGNIVIGNAGSGAYTAGTPAVAPGGTATTPYVDLLSKYGSAQSATDQFGNEYVAGVLVKGTSSLLSFPTDGGNLVVRAGGDIDGATLTTPSVSSWQLREGGGQAAELPEWGVNLNAYNWNFGTLGGGDVRISAQGSITNVTAAAAGSLLPQYGGGTQYVSSGGLALAAGGDVGSAQVFLANGTGSVAAGGALTATLPSITPGDTNVGSAFYLQSSSIDVTARNGIMLDGVFNPTALGQPSSSALLAQGYFSYGTGSGLTLQSISGDIDLGLGDAGTGGNPQVTLLGNAVFTKTGSDAGVFPANLTVQALSGNVLFGGGIGNGGGVVLYPSATGQLDLLAAKNIDASADASPYVIAMSDAAPGSYATVANPTGQTELLIGSPFTGDLHVSDPTPALVTAGGNILDLGLSIPKAAAVIAGQDIDDLTFLGQNLSATDQTILMAGRDFAYSNDYIGQAVSVGGPGALDILAGRNVSLGFSQGIVTTGNLLNANLPTAQGADLTIVTGLGTTPTLAAAFVKNVVAPSTVFQADLVTYVESLQGSSGVSFAAAQTAFGNLSSDQQQPFIDQIAFDNFLAKIIAPSTTYQAQLETYVQGLSGASAPLSFNAAETAFAALPLERQRPFIDQVFFDELSLSGLAANATPKVGFTEGYAAIDALFPGSRAASAAPVSGIDAGDLTLQFSRIYTLSGGNIDLVVPGGLINVGLANPPSILSSRSPSTLGIVAEGEGNVDIYTQSDVNVNSSRIFTLGGGDILIWSDQGSIDAGQGAKTSISAPPPAILVSDTGAVTLDFSGAAAGSGIRTIQTEPTTPAGNVDLIAPEGTVDAGDAGIGASGNINIAARSVIGATNINFGGTATGVPAQVSGIGASLAGASSASSSTSNAASNALAASTAEKDAAAPLAQTALTWLDVFVTGLGEENCKPDDIECLKRQKTLR
jgi:filamentous hemagglutinin